MQLDPHAETAELSKAPAEADNYAEHKAIRSGEKVAATPPATEKEPEEAEPTSEIAEGTEPSKETQEKEKKAKRDRSFDGRISELTARAKRAEEASDTFRRELESLRISRPAAEKPAEQPRTEAKPAADEAEPKLENFPTYEEWVKASQRHVFREERKAEQEQTRQAEAQKQRAEVQVSLQRKIVEAREKYPDFDQITAGDEKAQTGLFLTPAMQQYVVESDQGLDVGYWLGKNPQEAQRIRGLSPARQIAELGKIEDRLDETPKPPSTTPEKPKAPPVSKVSAPPRVVGGTQPAESKETSDAVSYAEHKRLRNLKRN